MVDGAIRHVPGSFVHAIGQWAKNPEAPDEGAQDQSEDGVVKDVFAALIGHEIHCRRERVVQDDGRNHRAKEAGWEVVVEVEDPSHGPERDVVEGPANQEPKTGLQGP